MKYEGTLNGTPIYSDPSIEKDNLYIINGEAPLQVFDKPIKTGLVVEYRWDPLVKKLKLYYERLKLYATAIKARVISYIKSRQSRSMGDEVQNK